MVEAILKRAADLKQQAKDFVLSAEGDLATALESYSAEQLARMNRSQGKGGSQTDLVIDLFLMDGSVDQKSPLTLFAEQQTDLSESDRALLARWHQSFVGVFEVKAVLPDGFELMNWMTTKTYIVKPNGLQGQEQLNRLQPGEILTALITPISDDIWMFSGRLMLLGKLSKPKLAVAIGNFKDQYPDYLYSDAPDLLQEAWKSVERHHYNFVDFFGSDEIELPGYQLEKRLAEFQQVLTEQQMKESGLDGDKTLESLAQEAGVSLEELNESVEELGVDPKTVEKIMKNPPPKMAAPTVELPKHLKNESQVTVVSHPRWGQVMLSNYAAVKQILESDDWHAIENGDKTVKQALEQPEFNTYLWERLARQYPNQLEAVLKSVLEREDFNLKLDLANLLEQYQKPLKPRLPETASVPLHLHNLFQDAVVEVEKNKRKTKPKEKTGFGFKRK